MQFYLHFLTNLAPDLAFKQVTRTRILVELLDP